MSALVVGYGNPDRGDDAAGRLVAELLEARGLPGVDVRALQQLQPELAEDLATHDPVVLVDASAAGPALRLQRLEDGPERVRASTHDFGPAALLRLTEALYGHAPRTFVCSLRGREFGLGAAPSPDLGAKARTAADWIGMVLAAPGTVGGKAP